jgi:glycine dehydrogenase subunit 1
MPYISHTENERQEMLRTIGVQTFNELIRNIPAELLLKKEINLPAPLSEFEVIQHLNQLSQKNINVNERISFLGGGAYDHFIPVAIDHLILRSEFYTSYTPYQPEVSQGTLQAIYEYQTAICEITGMDVANASMYDGGSALAEGALMAIGETQRKQIIVSKGVHPHYRQIIRTYCHGLGIEIIEIPPGNGITDLEMLKSRISDQTAAVLIQHPNFLGYLEEVDEIAAMVHHHGALFVTSNDPISLGVVNPPGAYDVDIMTGEGQVLGNSLNFGGPYLGIFAVKSQYVRRMPGRLVGATVDVTGKKGFVLTLQTREQHIRRAKATSNICTNQALNALIGTIYLTLMGKEGFQKVAELCLQKSHYLADAIQKIDGLQLKYKNPFFKEFVFEAELNSQELLRKLGVKKIIGGINLAEFDYNLPKSILTATTEKRTRAELDYYISVLKEIFN